MTEKERYENIDMPFYHSEVSPLLPNEILDFHAHIWKSEHWKVIPWKTDREGGKYLVTWELYGIDQLLSDGKNIFSDKIYSAVCFGYPSPAADLKKTNEYTVKASERRGLFPLLITGQALHTREEIERLFQEGVYFGFKVFLNWIGDDYGKVKVGDMIGTSEMEIANDLGLIVLLHVPGKRRLTDKEVQGGVREYAKDYPNVRIVLAHCGRCYHPDDMMAAVHSIKDLGNVYLDTSMVMDPTVLEILFDNLDSRRILFGTDFPVAAMRGRRVYAMDHWVDLVLEGYPTSSFRVASKDIRATFMAYEIVLAIKRAAVRVGLTEEKVKDIFYKNGFSLLEMVMDGKQLKKAQNQWQ